MIWGAGTGVFDLDSYSVLTTDSIITSPNKSGVFPSFYYTTTLLASSITSPPSDTFTRPPPFFPFPLTRFPWTFTLPPLPMTHFLRPPPLPPIPLKAFLLSLPNCLHFGALDFLAFAFVLPGVELTQRCLPFSSSYLAVMFLEQLVWSNCLAEEGSFPQHDAEIVILYVKECSKS